MSKRKVKRNIAAIKKMLNRAMALIQAANFKLKSKI